MSGHSKWANIKFRKATQDSKRGKVFTKIIQEINVSARLGGSDVKRNPRLRSAIDKALAVNMTRDTINRAIKRGDGSFNGSCMVEMCYEGYGPYGVAILVDSATDNKNRTVSEVRYTFSKHGGKLSSSGSVVHLFKKMGSIVFSNVENEEKIMDVAIKAGAEDVDVNGEKIEVLTNPVKFYEVDQALNKAGFKRDTAKLIQRSTTEIKLIGEHVEKVMKLIDELNNLEDVKNVFNNAKLIERA